MRFTLRLSLLLALALATAFAAAPTPSTTAKRPLTLDDFDAWRLLGAPVVSRDGRWLATSFMPQVGDGDVIVRELATGREQRLPVGTLPPPFAQPDEANPEAPPAPCSVRRAFTADSRHLVVGTHPAKADFAAARKAKKKPDEFPKNGLLHLNLATGAVTAVADVKNFQVSAKAGAWLAYLKEAKPAEKKSAAAPADPDAPPGPATTDSDSEGDAAARSATTTTTTAAATKPEFGADLILIDLAATTPAARTFANILDYSLARDGRTLLTTVAAKAAPAEDGVYAFTPGDSAATAPTALLAGKGKYLKTAWDREQTQAAFFSDRDDTAAGEKNPRFTLYHWSRARPAAPAVALVSAATANFPANFVIGDKGTPAFSRDGKKLYVPAALPPRPPRPALADPDTRVTADLWRWDDDSIQPIQRVRATLERNRTYRGVFDLATRRYTQLADATLPTVTLADDGTRALGIDDRPYRRRADYDGALADVYRVDASTGARTLALTALRNASGSRTNPGLTWSPDGRWACYYQAAHWHALNLADGSTRNLTATLGVPVHNELDDRPAPPAAHGAAGWTRDSQSFLVYDRYDVWQIFPDGGPAKNLTAGHGRATLVQLRVQNTEPFDEDNDDRGFDPAKPLVLRGESETTRASGFFQTRFDAAPGTAPRRLLWGDKNHRYVARARDADVLVLSASRFDEFPDYHTTDSAFSAPVKVTAGGAQLAAFAWGDAELVSFRNADGVPLGGALYRPPGFDPKKKYPLLVYIYERLSQEVHGFKHPAPSHNINFPLYTSQGYLVFTPDIVYTEGQPGQSAVKAVLPHIESLVSRGIVDEMAIGIAGHSWGGYQIAYLLTQTSRFRAAEAGAVVGNMTSAYSAIRWGSGLPRQFQYEKGQSRLGRSLTEAPHLYIENSPVFHVQRVTTPLLLLHNDADDAVPFAQGIELFLTLRRHEKQVWLWNYNGGLHGLRRRADQKDFARRTWEFFEHYLRAAPAPAWMTDGIPFLDREDEKVRAPSEK